LFFQQGQLSKIIKIYHSPDADDAFMFYGLSCGQVSYPGFDFQHELCDIQTLNERAIRAEIDCTAVSVHAYAFLSDKYLILPSGASMGGADYGPKLVAAKALNLKGDGVLTIASPGSYTSAALSLGIYLREQGINAEIVNLHFEDVIPAVKSGEVDAGVIIHEGQLTHTKDGLTCLVDFGNWWWQKHALPLPLGINVVKRELGPEAIKAVQSVLKGSIEYALKHRDSALDYALSYGRGITRADADRFVGMYVNDYTIDLGQAGMESIKKFLALGSQYKLIKKTIAHFADV